MATVLLVSAIVCRSGAHADGADASVPDGGTGGIAAGMSEIVYLNFSEGTENLTFAGADDAVTNRSNVGAAMPYPAFAWPPVATGATTRAEVVRRVVQRVHEIFLPYNVLVTTVRPRAGPYTMVLIGGAPRDIGVDLRVAGLAIQDCNNQEKSNLVFAFPEALRGNEQALAVTIAQEAAHSFGLEHTADRRDVMHPEIDPRQASFLDEESPILGDRICNNNTQNSHRKLLQTVGPWPGDTKPVDDGTRADRLPPRLALLSPDAPGARPLAQPFLVSATVEDEAGVARVVLTVAGERAPRHRPPWSWSLAGYPAGPLALTLTAYDASGNAAVATRTVELGPPPGRPSGCAVGAAGAASAGSGAGLPGGLLGGLALAAGALAGRRHARRPCARRRRPL